MSESRPLLSSVRRILVPFLVAVLLVVVTVVYSGSALIRVEDVTLNRVVAGTYGTPDWRVQEMNPLLAQLLTLLYNLAASINWYGVLLLALLAVSAATGVSLAARKRGGLIPAIIIMSPILVLLTNSVMSTAVCALAAVTGALSIMDGLQRKKEGIGRLVMGIVLFAFAVMLSLPWAIIIGVCAAICWLPCAVRESRMRGLLIGVLVMAVILAALFGYSALMYNSSELRAYRDNYTLYEKLQHSSLKTEYERLLEKYGYNAFSESHSEDDGHDHTAEELVEYQEIEDHVFMKLGWSINDADLFFTRYSADTELTSPEVLEALDAEASYWDFTPSRLFGELLETLKKPQFLMMIGLFIVSALAVLITSRRRGLLVLLAAVVAFGGHIVTIARFYDSFADIAPFYLLAIGMMLYFFDGEDAKGWMQRVFKSAWLRMALYGLVLVVFAAGMGGILYYTHITPANVNRYTKDAIAFLKPYIAEHKDMLYIGENPNERDKPDTLAAPGRGEDETLLAGSYDLYSPRKAALMEKYEITNPLKDMVGREDIGYVLIGFQEGIMTRLLEAYGLYTAEPIEVFGQTDYAEKIVCFQFYTQEEIDAAVAQMEADAENAALWAEALADLEAQGFFDDLEAADDHDHAEGEDHDHEDEDHVHTDDEHAVTAAPSASPTPAPSATTNG